MRILFFLEQLTPGGVEYYFLRKARALRERGHEVYFASAGGPLEQELAAAGIVHLTLPAVAQYRPEVPYPEALAQARILARFLASRGIRIVDTVAIRPFQLVFPIARARGIPVFLECVSPVHGVPVAQAEWVRQVAEAGRLTGVVPDDLEIMCARLGIDSELARIFPNPVDLARFGPGPSALREELGSGAGDFVILTVCRLEPDKSTYVQWLLDEVAALPSAGDPVWLAIAGDGSERPALAAHAEALGLSRVRFLGMRADLEHLYPGADAFVGMGTTVLEAAACGTAVVIANALSLQAGATGPEAAAMGLFGERGKGSAGYRIPGIEPSRFGPHLGRLRADPLLRAEVAAAGLALVRERHELDAVVDQWERAFEEAAAPPGEVPETGVFGTSRILFVTRPDALESPGGDTTQVLETRAALEKLGLEVDISFSTRPDGTGYDLAHVFNLQLADVALGQIEALTAAGLPVVLSTIFWEHAELEAAAEALRAAYAGPGAEREARLRTLAGSRPAEPSPRLAAQRKLQRQAAAMADLLLPNSAAEATTLGRALGEGIASCRVVPNGVDPERFGKGDAVAFGRRHGVRDFVLCAARWDDRKNLLQLCAAMEGAGLPLVLIGARPDAEYERLVRAHLPPGTLVLDHASPADLADAYAAARVHALPSWFETPGLSSLEAAAAGCALVVGDRAAEREYFGEAAYYCDPADVGSIRHAVETAWARYEQDRPRRDALRERILADYNWGRAAMATLAAYEQVLGTTLETAAHHLAPGTEAGPVTVLVAGAATPGWFDRVSASLGASDRLEPVQSDRFAEALARAATPLVARLEAQTALPDDWLERLRSHLAVDPTAGAAGPLLRDGAGLQRAQLHASGRGAMRVPVLSRACILLRKAAIDAVGGWDAGLAPPHAELDLAWRLAAAGHTLLLATDVVAEAPAMVETGGDVAGESADRLARKLEAHYGRGRVPSAETLWGVSSFQPAYDLWGPRPTQFLTDPADPARARILEAFQAAFYPDDPVRLDGELPEPQDRGDPDPAEEAARAVSAEPPGAPCVVFLEPGRPVTPDLLRQQAGFRPVPEARGLVSIVLLAIDAPDHARLCLDALARHTHEPYELIVVDGGVGERTMAELSHALRKLPDALWLRFPDAPSPSHLLNVGLAAAIGPYVALLKGDTLVGAGWLTYLLRQLEADPRRLAAGPRANAGPGDQPIPGLAYAGVKELDAFARRTAREHANIGALTPALGHFALLARRDLIVRIGGIDTRFPAGSLEAVDFALRARLAGGDLMLAQDVFVHSFGLAPPGTPRDPARGARGLARFEAKWGPLPDEPTVGDLEDRFAALAGRVSAAELLQPLPPIAGGSVVFDPVRIEGLKAQNLLLASDWDAPDRPWHAAVSAFVAAFDHAAPVALVLLNPPEDVVASIDRRCDELRPAGDGPDLLVVAGPVGLPAVVAACQGVLLTGGTTDVAVRRLAEILGIPVLRDVDEQALVAWLSVVATNPHAGFM